MPKGKRPLTAKGLATRQALLKAARQVFESEGYFQASVSQMGRRCGVSQGAFYQYFSNKEQVFRELIDEMLDDFGKKAKMLPLADMNRETGLRGILGLISEHCLQNAALHRVLNEYELIEGLTISYYDTIARFLREFFRNAVNNGHVRPLDPNVVAYSVIGMASFQQMAWGSDHPPLVQEQLVELTADLLEQGINGPKPWDPPRDLTAFAPAPSREIASPRQTDPSAGQRTKRAIFQAAEQVFGEYGYGRANISEITRRAGVAQGTFYVHFSSKDDLMNGVVRFLSHELRSDLRQITENVLDRRERERLGMLAFFNFLRRRSQIYRIVAESEAIGPQAAQYYYAKLADGYRRSLLSGMKARQIRRLPVDFLVRSLMGMNHMLGLRWLVWNSSVNPEIPRQALTDAVDLVLFGLAPAQKK